MRIEELYEKYASSVYLNEKKRDVKGLGLFYGKAGDVMVLLLLYKYLKKEKCFERANLFLDDIASHIAHVQDPGFMEGLAGIGWVVEWIAQNGFMKINTDEVLEEVDNQLYKSVLFTTSKDISVHNGLIGKALYFLSRFQSKNFGTHRYKTICHEECLVLLTDKVQKILFGPDGYLGGGHELSSNEIKQIGDAILFMIHLTKTGVNGSVVEDCIYKLADFVNYKLNSTIEKLHHRESYELFYLAYCYWKAGSSFKYRAWEEEGQAYLLSYIRKNGQCMKTNISLLYLMKDIHSKIKSPEFSTIIEKWSDDIYHKDIVGTLNNGWGSLILSELNLKYDKDDKWQEILICR